MFRHSKQSSPFDGMLIDARNERPMMIALATILMVWSLVFVAAFATGRSGAQPAHWDAASAILSSTGK